MALIDDNLRNRYTRDLDTAQALTQTHDDWKQLDELEPLHAELNANLAAAKIHYDKLAATDDRDDAGNKADNRAEAARLALQVATGLVAWGAGKPAQAELVAAMRKITKSKLDREGELDYSQLVSKVYAAAAPVKAELVKYFVPLAVTERLGTLHAAFDEMRGDGRLTQTEAAAARKALRAALSANDRKGTGVYDRMRVYLKPFKYGNRPLYDQLTNVMQSVDRRGRKKGEKAPE